MARCSARFRAALVPALVALCDASLTGALVAANWTVLDHTRCHGDIEELTGVVSLSDCEDACFMGPPYAQLVTYCNVSAAVCEGLAGHCWCYPATERSGCTNETGWLSALTTAIPPPPPPPPAPPADWVPSINSGDMLFWGGPLPKPGHMPSVGNGYVAKVVGPYHATDSNGYGAFYLAGVFNGVGNSTPSHRAAIPDLADVRIVPSTGTASNYSVAGAALNLRGAAWLNRTIIDTPSCRGGVVIQHRAYAHRAERSLFVVELRAWAADGGAWPLNGCTVPVQWSVDVSTPDFDAVVTPGPADGPAMLSLTAHSAEVPGSPTRRVAVAFPAWLAAAGGALNISFAADGDVVLAPIVFRSDLDAADPTAAAAADWTRLAAIGAAALQSSHELAMAALWDSGGIEIEGNLTIAAAANSSLYYILAALRSDVTYSTCPGGLATNSYNGHSCWDMETW